MSLSVVVLCAVVYLAGCEKKADTGVSKTCVAGCTKPCCTKADDTKACSVEATVCSAQACPADCTKPCCAAKDGEAKTCPPDCTKPCCAATDEAKTCLPDCMKVCCADKTASAVSKPTVCPVMEGPINKELFTEYKGKKVYFCCAGCEDTFLKDPEKYLSKLPQFK